MLIAVQLGEQRCAGFGFGFGAVSQGLRGVKRLIA